MRIERRIEGRVVVLELTGRFVGDRGPEDLRGAIGVALAEGNRSLLLDCRGLEWISSTGIGQFVAAWRLVREAGGHFRVCELTQSARRAFEIAGLGELMEVCCSRDEALEAFLMDGSLPPLALVAEA